MAYAVTYESTGDKNGDFLLVKLAGTSIEATSEATITMPEGHRFWTLLRLEQINSSGTSTTSDPVLGAMTDPATSRPIIINGSPVAQGTFIDLIPSNGFKAVDAGDDGELFYRDVPDAGADNVTNTWLYFRRGW